MPTAPLTKVFDDGRSTPGSTQDVRAKPRLHRLATVRRQQGLSQRYMARQLNQDVREIRAQEEETSDLRLSQIFEWQEALDVPLVDLLVDPGTSLSKPVMERARLLRMMKTAAAIGEEAQSPAISRLAKRLSDQLIEIMPELKEVGAWHAVGQRRSLDDLGRAFERRISDDALFNFSSVLEE